MASTLTDYLNMSMPANGDDSWGDEIRNAMVTLDELAAVQDVWFVSPKFTAANLYPNGTPGSTQRRFCSTIAEAISAAEATTPTRERVIFVYPGQYNENLSITKDMTIAGVSPVKRVHDVGTSGVPKLHGSEGSATITITPPAATRLRVTVANLNVTHGQTTAGGPNNSYGQFVYIPDQGPTNYGSGPNLIHFVNTNFRYTASVGYRFESLIKSIGWVNMAMIDCSVRATNPYGGANAYQPQYHYMIQGNVTGNKASLLQLRGCTHNHPTGTDAIIRHNNNGNIQCVQNVFESDGAIAPATRPVRSTGSGGQNGFGTMTSTAEAESKGNVFSVEANYAYV